MGLKEIIAAKKAASEAAAKASTPLATSDPVAHQQAITDNAAEKEANEADNHIVPVVQPEPVATTVSPLVDSSPAPEPATVASEKPLTFAEKMAIKKASVTAAQAVPQVKKEVAPLVIDPSMIPENPEDAQAYVDIKTKIHQLEGLFDDNLKGAMTELKAALKKNPNATELMLDADVGKMVTALRRMTHVAQVEATTKTKAAKTAKSSPKAKEVALTKEQIEAAFNEL